MVKFFPATANKLCSKIQFPKNAPINGKGSWQFGHTKGYPALVTGVKLAA
jgi:hypothetical protein